MGIHLIDGALAHVGKKMTVSLYVRKGSAFTSDLSISMTTRATKFSTTYDSGSINVSNASLNTSTFTRVSFSFDITTATSTASADLFELDISATQAGAANAFFEIASVQMEIGSAVSPFRRSSATIQAELAACMRYYITGTWAGSYYIGTSNATGYGFHGYSFAPMRVTPTATILTFTSIDNATNGGISVMGNGTINGNFRNSNTSFTYYQFTATFKLEAEL
jgi:hypothetical protein